jgi:hypothetical protein
MKNQANSDVRLIEALPTVFGLIAVSGIALVYLTDGAANDVLLSVKPLMVLWGVALTFVTSLISVIAAFTGLKRTRGCSG